VTLAVLCERCAKWAPYLYARDGKLVCDDCTARERAIRAVVAAQWAVAIGCDAPFYGHRMRATERDPEGRAQEVQRDAMIRYLAALLTPEQIVDGGEPAPVVRP
jgi:hypothetical protein